MFWLAITLVVVNLFFLSLGVLLYDYGAAKDLLSGGLKGDELFAAIALSGELGTAVAVLFIVGLIAAAYSSADSALTALTTSFSVDILGVQKLEAKKATRLRKQVHVLFSVLLLLVILVFKEMNDDSVIKELFVAAGYTYGPLLGLYAFGLFTKKAVLDPWVPAVAIIAPILSFILKENSTQWFGYTMSFEHLIVNGALTFLGLWVISRKAKNDTTP
jgi:Na+/proline symporter